MNVNASIVDQQLTGILQKHPEWFPAGDANKQRSAAFVLQCMATSLDIPQDQAADLLTDGGNDAGVDGIHLGEVEAGGFLVTIFQGKYKIGDYDGKANFPENGVRQAVNTVQILFDPFRKIVLNDRLAPVVEEIRSLILDGYIPRVRFILCNNGMPWNDIAQGWIDELQKDYPAKVEVSHYNHDTIVGILQRPDSVDASILFSGQVIVEDLNYCRVLVGRISADEIVELLEKHGDMLLQRNIRRFLGLDNNQINTAIKETLHSEKSDRFYYYNNGITMVCDRFDYNAFQKGNFKVQLQNLQIINGAQTCKTIHQTMRSAPLGSIAPYAYVMVRVYQLNNGDKDFVQDITFATNRQNPVDQRDLRSNDDKQITMEIGMQDLGYTYKRQRHEGNGSPEIITSAVAAEATLAVWREKPHQAKFLRREHFGKLYDEIFSDLNPAQAILAVLIFRSVENERKRPTKQDPPSFMPYASHYISMLVGRNFLNDLGIALTDVTHQNFKQAVGLFNQQSDEYQAGAVGKIGDALVKLYGEREVSLQQLSATFRRGDLLEFLTD